MDYFSKGAEAYIYVEKGKLIKHRKSKKYRIEEIDKKLIKTRTKKESTALKKCNENKIPSPELIEFNSNKIMMSFIEGKTLSSFKDEKYYKQAGTILAKLHKINLCHGDFTPNNLIVNQKNDKVYVIDFGLCEFSTYIEKKSTDLRVMKDSLKNKQLFDVFISSYLENYNEGKKVFERYIKNESRGRYKERI
jgi:TP53 regulating kinase and related kinases